MKSREAALDDSYFERPMSSARKAVSMLRKIPGYLRNVAFSRFSYWPVSSIAGSDLQDVPVYCISLRSALGRRALISKQVSALRLRRFQFVDAVDAGILSLSELVEQGLCDRPASEKYHKNGLTLNEIACSLSHRAAYQFIVDAGHSIALVLEDDALFNAKRVRELRLSEVPEGFDLLFLNSFLYEEPPRGHVFGRIYDTRSYRGSAAAYLVTQRAAGMLLDCSLPVIHAADGLVGRSIARMPFENKHSFKQVGAKCALRAYLYYPDCVLNGSTCHYHVSQVQ